MISKKIDFTPSEKRRNVKKHLLSKGVKYSEMAEYLKGFFTKYGHTNLEGKTLEQLFDLASIHFISLKKYTNGR